MQDTEELESDLAQGHDQNAEANGVADFDSFLYEPAITLTLAKYEDELTPPKEKALFEAINQGRLEEVQTLIAEGVNIECRDPCNLTPLLRAGYKHQYEILKYLIDAKANLCVVDSEGENIFQVCFGAFRGSDCPQLTELLMQALKANSEAWSFYSKHYWWGDAIIAAAGSGKDDSLRVLLRHLESYSEQYKVEQERIAFKGSYLEFHSDYFRDNGSEGRWSRSVLSIVCRECQDIKQGHQILIQAGADIKAKHTVDKRDVLSISMDNAHTSTQVTRDLIGIIKKDKTYCQEYTANGGFVQALKYHLCSGNEYFFNKRFREILEILMDEVNDDVMSVDLFRIHFSQSMQKNKYEEDPFHDPLHVILNYVASYETESSAGLKVFNYFIRHGAAIDRQCEGKTPLERALVLMQTLNSEITTMELEELVGLEIRKNRKQNLQTIIERLVNAEKLMALCKGSLNLKEEQAMTTLNQLVAAGVSVNQVDRDNRTPLYHAVESGQEQLVQALISLSANPHYDCSPDAVAPVIPNETPLFLAMCRAISTSPGRIYLALVEKTVSLEIKETKEREEVSSLVKWRKIEDYINKDFRNDPHRKNLVYFIMGKRLKYEVSTNCDDKETQSVNYLSFKFFSVVQETSPYFKEASYEIADLLVGGCLVLNDQDEIIDPLVEEQSLDTSIVSLDQNPQSNVEPKLALDLKPSSLNGSKPPAIMQNVKVAFVYAMRAQGCHEEARRLRENIIAEMIGLKWGVPHGLKIELEGPKVLVETRLIESLFSRIRVLQNNCEVLQDKCEVLQDKYEVLQDKCEVLQDKCEVLQDKCEVLQDKCEVSESSAASSLTADPTSTPLSPPLPPSSALMSAQPSPSAMVPQFGEERHRKKRDREEGSSASSGRSTKYSCR